MISAKKKLDIINAELIEYKNVLDQMLKHQSIIDKMKKFYGISLYIQGQVTEYEIDMKLYDDSKKYKTDKEYHELRKKYTEEVKHDELHVLNNEMSFKSKIQEGMVNILNWYYSLRKNKDDPVIDPITKNMSVSDMVLEVISIRMEVQKNLNRMISEYGNVDEIKATITSLLHKKIKLLENK